MQYVRAPQMESLELAVIPSHYGKTYAPQGGVGLDRSVVIESRDLDHIELGGERVALHPDSFSWAFLSGREAALVADLEAPRSFGWLADQWPTHALDAAEAFAARLYRRGLVTLDGHASIDSQIFRDSPNVPGEGNLVELLLTEKCNLACGYCLAGAHQKMPEMTPEIARRAVDLAYGMNESTNLTFEFSGGEPFIKFGLMQEIVTYIREHPRRGDRPVAILVQTNGTLLTRERVEWVKANDIGIGLSLDGDPESQNLSRPQVNGKESFSKVLRGVDLLQRAGIPFGVLVVLNRSNVHSAEALLDFLVENDLGAVKLNPIAYIGTARTGWERFGIEQKEVTEYLQDFFDLSIERDDPVVEANLHDMMRNVLSKQRRSRCLRGHCGAGETFQAVTAAGNIHPCGRATQSPGLMLGNVLSETHSLSAPGRRNLLIQQIKERRPKTLEDCVTCAYREVCQSGCSAQAFERYGTVRHKTPECAMNKAMFPYLMRRLSFDDRAVDFVNRNRYFGPGETVEIVRHSFLPG